MSVDKDLISVQQARDLVEAAHRAQAEVAQFDQGKIDRICEAMARAALREAARSERWPLKKPVTAFPPTNKRRTGSPPKMFGTTFAACAPRELFPSRKT